MLCNKCHIQYIWLVINYPYTKICILSILRKQKKIILFQLMKHPEIFQHQVGTLNDI